jgi:hypothetical protein
MIRTTIKHAVTGFFIGMPVGVVILLILSYSNSGGELVFSELMLVKGGSEAGALALQVFLSGILGAICWAGMTFYEIECWGMLKSFIVHYAVILTSFIIIGLNSDWIAPDAGDIGFMALILGAAYFVVWLIIYLHYRSSVRQLNVEFQELTNKKAA